MAVNYNPVDLEAFGSNTTESTELRLGTRPHSDLTLHQHTIESFFFCCLSLSGLLCQCGQQRKMARQRGTLNSIQSLRTLYLASRKLRSGTRTWLFRYASRVGLGRIYPLTRFPRSSTLHPGRLQHTSTWSILKSSRASAHLRRAATRSLLTISKGNYVNSFHMVNVIEENYGLSSFYARMWLITG